MSEVQQEAPGFAPDADDDGPLFPDGSQGEESGSVPADPVADEPGQGQQEAASDPPAAEAEGESTAGKRIVLAAPAAVGPFHVVTRGHLPGAANAPNASEPLLFEGDDREARLEALEEIETLGKQAAEKPGTVFLVTVPAASWKPKAPKPRPRKTDWTV